MKNTPTTKPGQTSLRNRLRTMLAISPLLLVLGTGMASANGSAYFNYTINWPQTPDLYFSVAGGPASTCGDLVAVRNGGAPQTTPGWLCTDASGNATKGPWSWANQANDETASSYIRWPDNSTTNTVSHIWDKTAPTASISSSGTPPTSYSGTGHDTTNGACFSANWSTVTSTFEDTSTGLYWSPGQGYSAQPRCHAVPPGGCVGIPVINGTLSGMPSCSVTWSTSFPPAGDHTSGHSYLWKTCVYDGGQYGCATLSFTP
ncbi:MAG: hypothetical protein JF614_25975 [Acidobacteria bacterium]|nr:hypothetical protein [Acidobacteriota bacterium]